MNLSLRILRDTTANIFCTVLAAVPLVLAAATSAHTQDLPRAATIGTNPQGSLYYATGSGVATILSEHMPVNVRVRPFSGTTQFIPLAATGRIEFSVSSSVEASWAYTGHDPFAQSFENLRAVSPLIRLQIGMLVRNDSEIQELRDAKSKRITGGYRAHLMSRMGTEAFLKNANLSWNDFDVVQVSSHVDGIRALREDRADVVLASFNPAVREAEASISGGVRFLNMYDDPESAERILSVMPGTFVEELPKDFHVGFHEPLKVLGWSGILNTGADVSDELVYQVTKALWEQAEQLREQHPALKRGFSRERMIDAGISIPYHSGAIRFYKEVGAWTEEMEQAQARLLKANN